MKGWQSLRCPEAIAMELHAVSFLDGLSVDTAAQHLVDRQLAPDPRTALLWIGWFACKESLQQEGATQFEREQRSALPGNNSENTQRGWPALDFWREAYLVALRGLIDPVTHAQTGNVAQRAREIANEALAEWVNAEQRGIAEVGELVKFANAGAKK